MRNPVADSVWQACSWLADPSPSGGRAPAAGSSPALDAERCLKSLLIWIILCVLASF